MERVFLDANILFSAAYRADSDLTKLWNKPESHLLTSAYALEEARRNLDAPRQRKRLSMLARGVTVVPEAPPDQALPSHVRLPDKDRPIVLAAMAAGATYLLTGDQTHFADYYGKKIGTALVLRPAEYLKLNAKRGR